MRDLLWILIVATGCTASRTPPAAPTAPAGSASPALREEVLRQDQRMGDAFNAHDGDRLMAVFARDLEFIHDADGFASYEQVDHDFRGMFASLPDMRRELVGPVEVYPIKDYGAIEIAAHRFCHTEHGKLECGVFHFLHVWHRTPDGWQISRVVSYGH